MLGDEERQRLMAMGADPTAVWDHPPATAATRKRLLRAVLTEIVARIEEDRIELLLYWQGGDHTALAFWKNSTGQHCWATEPDTEALLRALARLVPDNLIASLLNRLGRKTGRLNGWTESRVRSFRHGHGIAMYQEGERASRGEVTLDEAAERLHRSSVSVLRLIRTGILPGQQHCKGTPWVIEREGVETIAAGDEGRGLLYARRH